MKPADVHILMCIYTESAYIALEVENNDKDLKFNFCWSCKNTETLEPFCKGYTLNWSEKMLKTLTIVMCKNTESLKPFCKRLHFKLIRKND